MINTKEDNLEVIGGNIRYLRKHEKLTIAGLSSKIDIKPVQLGRIERSENIPSTYVLRRLSNVFNISMDAFFSKSIEELKSYQIESTNDPVQAIEKHLSKQLSQNTKEMVFEIIEAIQQLEEICGVRKHANIPLLIPFDPNKKGIENLSEKVRQYMDIGNSIVFDYFDLFESRGLKVVSIKLPKDIFSFSYYDHINQNAFFFIDSSMTPERQIFSLINELGVILISTYSIQQKKELFKGGEIYHNQPFDMIKAAKLFAANFLMPKISLKRLTEQLNITEKDWSFELLLRIKSLYGVSAQALLIRLRHLQLINDEHFRSFESRILNYYKHTGNKEPGIQKRIITHNGRLSDLLILCKSVNDERMTKVKDIIDNWQLPLIQTEF